MSASTNLKIQVRKRWSIRPWLPFFVIGVVSIIGSVFLQSDFLTASKVIGMIGFVFVSFFFFEEMVRLAYNPLYDLKIEGDILLINPQKNKNEKYTLSAQAIKKVLLTRYRFVPIKGPRNGEIYRIVVPTHGRRFIFDWRINEYEMKNWQTEYKKFTGEYFQFPQVPTPSEFLVNFFHALGVPKEKIFYYHNDISDWGL